MANRLKTKPSRAASSLPHLAGRIFGQPLLIEPLRGQAMLNAIGPRFILAPTAEGIVPVRGIDLQADENAGLPGPLGAYAAQSVQPDDCDYQVIDGVAVLPIHGTLVQRGGWLSAMCGIHSYSWIGNQIQMALDDSNVGAILLDMDTPGGEVSGCFDLADMIYQARGVKPIWSVANEMAFSAGYALASAAERIILTRTAGVGSIGVITMHADYSKAESDFGVKVTAIYAGDRKNDYSHHEPLSREARKLLQDEINRVYGLFADTVARNRGMSDDDVRATEAGLFWGPNAVDAGLADEIGTIDEAVAALAATINGREGATIIKQGSQAMPANIDTNKPKAAAETPAEEKDDKKDKTDAKVEGDDKSDDDKKDKPEAKAEDKKEDDKDNDKEKPDAKAKKAGDDGDDDEDEGVDANANAAAIVDACMSAGVPQMASSLIKEGLSVKDAKARIDTAGEIRGLVDKARKMQPALPANMAETFIAAGTPVAQVRAQLFDNLVETQSGPISSAVTPGAKAGQPGGGSADAGWGAAFAKAIPKR